MTKEKNNGGRGGDLLPPFCARPAIIVDLWDAAAFIDMHGDRTRLWVTAETAVKCADRIPRLIDQATKTLENALRLESMLHYHLATFTDRTHIADSPARAWSQAFRRTY